MPKAIKALMDVEEALRMRELARRAGEQDPVLSCPECGERIRPHEAGGHTAAHFEHDDRQSSCSLSDHGRP